MAKNTLVVAPERQTAFMKHGTPVPANATVAQAIKAAKLDWEVEMVPAAALINGKAVEVPHRHAVVRSDTHEVFDFVGGGYTPIQNATALGVADDLRQTMGVEFGCAGTLAGGRVVWMQVRIPTALEVDGDAHELHALIDTSHDGKRATRLHLTPVRLTCVNQMNLAVRKAKQRWSVRHVSTAEGRLAEAQQAVGLVEAYSEAFVNDMTRLLGYKMGEKALDTFLDALIPKRPKKADEVMAIKTLALTADTCEHGRGTGYAAINAVREYFDHVRPQRTSESAFIGALTGVNKRTTDRAMAMLLARASGKAV